MGSEYIFPDGSHVEMYSDPINEMYSDPINSAISQ